LFAQRLVRFRLRPLESKYLLTISQKRSQDGFGFKKLCLIAVLFPTFALQYHVPFRNEIEALNARAYERCVDGASVFYGAGLR